MQVQLGHCLIRWKWPLEPLNGKIVCSIQGVPGGKDLTSGECSLGQTIPI